MGVLSRTEWKILISFWLLFIVFSQNLGWSELTRTDLSLAIVDHGSLSIDEYYQNTGDRILLDGHYYSDKPPGSSFLAAPVYLLYRSFFGQPDIAGGLYEPLSDSFRLLIFLNIVLITSLLGALSVVLVYRTARFYTQKRSYLIWVVLSYGLSALIFAYSRTFMNHIISAFLVILSFYLLLRMKHGGKRDHSLLIGVLAGFGVMNEYSMIIVLFFLLSLMVYYFRSWKKTLLFLGGAIILLVLLASYNYSITGSVQPGFIHADRMLWNEYADCLQPRGEDESLYCSAIKESDESLCSRISDPYIADGCYLDVAVKERSFEICYSVKDEGYRNDCMVYILDDPSYCENSSDVLGCNLDARGLSFLYPAVRMINDPVKHLSIFLRLLIYPYRGMLFYMPILLLSITGLFFMYRKHRFESLAITALWFLFLAYNTLLSVWWGGWCFGPRHLVPLMPILMIPLIFSFKKVDRRIVFLLLSLTILISLIGLHVPEESALGVPVDNLEPVGNPLLNHYLPLTFQEGISTMMFSDIFGTSNFFNILLLLLALLMMWKKELW